MPYVTQAVRDHIARGGPATTKGDLTYQITLAVLDYLKWRAEYNPAAVRAGPSFDHYADAIAALECAKLELYRRLLAPYEDRKIQENGDVY